MPTTIEQAAPAPLAYDSPPADILDRAADIIAANGRHQGALWDLAGFVPWAPTMPCCAAAAIGIALGQHTVHNVQNWVIPSGIEGQQDQPPHPAFAALMAHLDAPTVQHVFAWSDEHEASEIAAAMRDCAAKIRAEVA